MYQQDTNSINGRLGIGAVPPGQIQEKAYIAQQQQITGNYGAKEPQQPSLLDELEKRFHAHLDHLNTLTLRLRNVGDRVFGASPEAAGQGANTPPSSSAINRLDNLLAWMATQTGALSDEVARLERL